MLHMNKIPDMKQDRSFLSSTNETTADASASTTEFGQNCVASHSHTKQGLNRSPKQGVCILEGTIDESTIQYSVRRKERMSSAGILCDNRSESGGNTWTCEREAGQKFDSRLYPLLQALCSIHFSRILFHLFFRYHIMELIISLSFTH